MPAGTTSGLEAIDGAATTMETTAIDLTVVVPVFNGESFIGRTIGRLIEYLSSLEGSAELIVVDDGSSDRTAEIVRELIKGASIPVQLERCPSNRGKGAAISRGMALARGRHRVFLDADLAYPPQAIDEIRARLAAGADVVIGSRVHADSTYVVKPSFFRYLYTRHLAGRIFNVLVRFFLLPGIYDSQAGLKGFTAGAADILFGGWLPDGFSFDLGVLSRARHEGLRIEQIPVHYRYDSEPTTVRFVSDTVGALYDLMVVRLRIGGEYSKKGIGRVTAWLGRQLGRVSAAAASPKAATSGVLAIVFGLAGHIAFRSTFPNNFLAFSCWLVAIAACVLLAVRNDTALPRSNRPVFATGGELGVFLAILGLAAVLRLWNLSELPPTIHGDSAECGIQGLRILSGQARDLFGFSPWYWTPYPAYLPYAFSLAIAGTSVLGLRLPSAVFGILAMIPLYFLVRGWLGRRAAQIATVLFALSHSAIHFSRIGLWNIQALFLALVAFALVAAAVRSGRTVLATWVGLTAGFGFYTYTGGRLILVVVVAFLAFQLLLGPRRRWIQVVIYGTAGLAVALTPLIVTYTKSPEILASDRTGSVLALAEINRKHVQNVTGEVETAKILRVQAIRSIRGFYNTGDRSGQYGNDTPLAAPLTALLALVGIAIALLRFGEPESRLVLLWTVLGLILGSILIIDPPSHTRLIVLFPVPFIFTALTLETLFRRLEKSHRVWSRPVIAGACILVIGQAAIFNLDGYRSWVRRVYTEGRIWDVVKVVEGYGNSRDYYFFGGPTMSANAPGLRLLAGNYRIVNGISTLDVPPRLLRDTIFIIPYRLPELEPQMRNVGTVITEMFPNSRREIVGERSNPQLILYVVENGGHVPPPGG